MISATESENSRIKKSFLFTNRNIYSISFVEAEKKRLFFTVQSAEKDSNQSCEYIHINK
jgi:hypothetical protein